MNLQFSTLFIALLIVCCDLRAIADSITYDIQAYIDEHNQMIISGNTLYWTNLIDPCDCYYGAAVGRWNSNNLPTIISTMYNSQTILSGINWYPTWPEPPPAEANYSASSSLFTRLSPSLPANGNMSVSLIPIEARGTVTLVQSPSAANNYALIVEIYDPQAGAAWYHIQLVVSGFSTTSEQATITSVNVGPAGGGNLTMSILGSGFGTTSGIQNAVTNLVVYDINSTTGTTNWSLNGTAINIKSWTNNEIDIESFNFPILSGYDFTIGDQITIQVQNPQTQTGWSSPYALKLPPGYLVLEIQPPQNYPLVLSHSEMTSLYAAINQLSQPNSRGVVGAVVPVSTGWFGPQLDLALVTFLIGLPTAAEDAASDIYELGWLGLEPVAIASTSDYLHIWPATTPVSIVYDVAENVHYEASYEFEQDYLSL